MKHVSETEIAEVRHLGEIARHRGISWDANPFHETPLLHCAWARGWFRTDNAIAFGEVGRGARV